MRPANLPLSKEDLTKPKDELHELLVGAFGAYLMWCREQALENVRLLIESEEAREKITRVLREPFERAASEL